MWPFGPKTLQSALLTVKNNVAVCVYQYVHLNVCNLYWDSSSMIKLLVWLRTTNIWDWDLIIICSELCLNFLPSEREQQIHGQPQKHLCSVGKSTLPPFSKYQQQLFKQKISAVAQTIIKSRLKLHKQYFLNEKSFPCPSSSQLDIREISRESPGKKQSRPITGS